MDKLKSFVANLSKKQKILITIGLSLFAILLIVIIVCCSLPKSADEPGDESSTGLVVDYNQLVANEDGSSFNGTFKVGESERYAIRFPNISCKDDCKNVSDVRLGNQLLKKGSDYEIKEGSVIIVLLKHLLVSLKTGHYNLTFEYNDGEFTKRIGVKITIENEALVCNEDQVLTNGECVTKEQPKPDETDKPESNNDNNSDNNSSSNENSADSPNNNNSSSNDNAPQTPSGSMSADPTPDSHTEPEKPTPSEPDGPNEPDEPEVPVHTAEFNLNDGYDVEITRIRWLQTDDIDSCYSSGVLTCPEIVFGWCAVQKDEVEIKKVFFGAGETLMTEAQFNAKQQEATNNGYQSVEGYGIVPVLDEDNCALCSLSCDRW